MAHWISIHALREEGDRPQHSQHLQGHPISIHALREEGDSALLPVLLLSEGFLSTPSARRATTSQSVRPGQLSISIHALREEGDIVTWRSDTKVLISIHALREEGDQQRPLRPERASDISIHALREEGDYRLGKKPGHLSGISIHALREEGDQFTSFVIYL